MKQGSIEDADFEGWDWFERGTDEITPIENDDLVRSFVRCFNGSDGAIVLRHLRETTLDRRLGPKASDAELRYLEGQRSVVAHVLAMIDRDNR